MDDIQTEHLDFSKFDHKSSQFYIGLILAISSSLFIGSSFIIKKLSLKKLNQVGLRASAGGYGYLKDWTWWIGLLTMGVGELANFVAYAFAPASLVTPLGALSILVSAILASKFLNEALSTKGKIGCVLCIIGSTIIVVYAPKEEEFQSLDELLSRVTQMDFLYYLSTVCLITIIVCFMGPKYGTRYVIVYLSVCSSIGSLTVMSCKALGLSIKSYFLDELPIKHAWMIFVLFLLVVVFICTQMNYLNKSLDIFDTSVVTPVYYVMFTSMVIIASGVLFREWANMDIVSIFGTLLGFTITVGAIFLLNASKEKQVKVNLYNRVP
ncbi:magnesium transporter NIPA2 [Sitophilus oryzae]|uniref:Magnesium transporter NIPA2 n=1 Tax=Sitophilus oryzae TaxID=7048 RepID=A0A6J2Y942_SITOR|nr:magnesium transporter NIPA2 [Sitophilus oryzae]